MSKRILVSFGRSDPLHLTEATHEILGDGPDYIWGPDFNREMPCWARTLWMEAAPHPTLYDYLSIEFNEDEPGIVYCGHGATLLEATAAGCEVMVLSGVVWSDNPTVSSPKFIPAWTRAHLDHSGREVRWWEPGSMAAMAAEIRARRK